MSTRRCGPAPFVVGVVGAIGAIGAVLANGGRPAIWMSSDGSAFERADTAGLSPPGSRLALADAGASGGVTVAVGTQGSACETPTLPEFSNLGCSRRAGIAWWAADGRVWEQATARTARSTRVSSQGSTGFLPTERVSSP